MTQSTAKVGKVVKATAASGHQELKPAMPAKGLHLPGDPLPGTCRGFDPAPPWIEVVAPASISLRATSVQGGKKLHVAYEGGIVEIRMERTDPEDGTTRTFQRLGRVLTGSDWVFLRSDGVVVFDGHFTLGHSKADVGPHLDERARRGLTEGLKQDPEDFVMDVFLSGLAPTPRDFVLEEGGPIEFVLPARVEMATDGPGWAKARFQQLAKRATPFEVFTKSQCLALGHIEIASQKISKITLGLNPLDLQAASKR
jgi:hypothetical protein